MPTPQPSAVRFYSPDHPALAATIRARLEQRRKELLDHVLLAADWPDYTKRRGTIYGIDEAIRLCDEVEKELNERHK